MTHTERLARKAFDAALRAGHPAEITRAAIANLTKTPTAIVALGKAAAAMAQAARDTGLTAPGVMVTNDENYAEIDGMHCFASAHPVPDERGLAASAAILALVDGLGAADHLLLLISGGGSALVPAPPAGLSLADKQQLNAALLASGMDIHEMNVVRRLFSDLKGGRLARRAFPAQITQFLLSDVPGDRLESIASGPAVPDPVPFEDAVALMTANGLMELPFVAPHLDQLRAGKIDGPLRPHDPETSHIRSHILASNNLCQSTARATLAAAAPVRMLLPPLTGDVRDCAVALADAVCSEAASCSGAINFGVTGGETTVQLGAAPTGLGGRSQELALLFAREMHNRANAPAQWVVLAGGTDGRDGPTDAAGAVITSEHPFDAVAAKTALGQHDVYHFLHERNQLLVVEPTGTNLGDLVIIAIAEPQPERSDNG